MRACVTWDPMWGRFPAIVWIFNSVKGYGPHLQLFATIIISGSKHVRRHILADILVVRSHFIFVSRNPTAYGCVTLRRDTSAPRTGYKIVNPSLPLATPYYWLGGVVALPARQRSFLWRLRFSVWCVDFHTTFYIHSIDQSPNRDDQCIARVDCSSTSVTCQ